VAAKIAETPDVPAVFERARRPGIEVGGADLAQALHGVSVRIVHGVNTRVSAGAWFLLALVLLSTFANELRGEVRGTVLFMAATLGISAGWIGYRLWRRPSRVAAVISACLAGFLLFLAVVAVLQGAVGRPPWGILIPVLLVAFAALLPLKSWDRLA
jgi:hypothetical protein